MSAHTPNVPARLQWGTEEDEYYMDIEGLCRLLNEDAHECGTWGSRKSLKDTLHALGYDLKHKRTSKEDQEDKKTRNEL